MKKKILIALTAILLFTIILLIFSAAGGKKPFKDLEQSEITAASVRLTPPDKTVQIHEIDQLLSYLKDVVIYNKDSSYKEYSGQAVTVTLTMTDGSQITIMGYNPFLVINGVGYRTAYGPCEALSTYANRLLEEAAQ